MIPKLRCGRSLERGRDVRVDRSVGRESRDNPDVRRYCVERSLAGVIGIRAANQPIAHFKFDIVRAQAATHPEALAQPYLVVQVCTGAGDNLPLVQRQTSALGAEYGTRKRRSRRRWIVVAIREVPPRIVLTLQIEPHSQPVRSRCRENVREAPACSESSAPEIHHGESQWIVE